jgi:hypothetical protein
MSSVLYFHPMAKRLNHFPDDQAPQSQRRYPWPEWTDGSTWEIRQGVDYDVATENMRVNLHVKADSLGTKVRTKKISDTDGEGLVFQFLPSEEKELVRMSSETNPEETEAALNQLYEDALEIYDRAREEVTIPRKDGTRQKYAANRFKQQIDKGRAEGMIVPTIARIVRKPTLGFGHLENAGRRDLMVENLVIDRGKPYHRLFSEQTVRAAKKRMDGLGPE